MKLGTGPRLRLVVIHLHQRQGEEQGHLGVLQGHHLGVEVVIHLHHQRLGEEQGHLGVPSSAIQGEVVLQRELVLQDQKHGVIGVLQGERETLGHVF